MEINQIFSGERGQRRLVAFRNKIEAKETFSKEEFSQLKNEAKNAIVVHPELKSQIENLISIAEKKVEGYKTSKNDSDNKKEGCYIATAVYGNYNHPNVKILRDYRDNVLMRNSFGRVGVKTYYLLSPSLSKYLHKSKRLKYLSMIALSRLISRINSTK